jgi:hypothetical protein
VATYSNREDLIRTTLNELKVTSYGTPPSAEEHDAIDKRIDGILAELSARNIVTVSDTDFIPVEILTPLSQVLARHVGSQFSVMADELDKMFGPEMHPFSPESRLRSINRSGPTGAPAQTDYF